MVLLFVSSPAVIVRVFLPGQVRDMLSYSLRCTYTGGKSSGVVGKIDALAVMAFLLVSSSVMIVRVFPPPNHEYPFQRKVYSQV